MSRVGTALGTVAVAAALVVTAASGVGHDDPRGRPADSSSAAVPDESSEYVMPLDGEMVTPFDDPEVPWGPGHRGVDIAGAAGAAVRAAGVGVVAFAGVVVDRPVLSIDHPDGIRTTYEPVTAVVQVGDHVERGEVIGHLLATSSHCPPRVCLHWGARVGDAYLDPLSLVQDAVIRLYPTTQHGRTPPSPAATRPRSGRGAPPRTDTGPTSGRGVDSVWASVVGGTLSRWRSTSRSPLLSAHPPLGRARSWRPRCPVSWRTSSRSTGTSTCVRGSPA